MKMLKIHLLRFDRETKAPFTACGAPRKNSNTWEHNTTCKKCLKVAKKYNGVY